MIRTLAQAILILGFSVDSIADVLLVPDGHASIQLALDASSPGDEIVVSQGVYLENLVLPGHDLTLRSVAPLDPQVVAATVIDGQEIDSTILLSGTETAGCVIEGLTIRNGRAREIRRGFQGGGIYGNESLATIRHNRIVQNTASNGGGGIAVHNGGIINNIIEENISYTSGGGIDRSDGMIYGNLIIGNSAGQHLGSSPASSMGGGIGRCSGLIENNIIVGNFSRGAAPSAPPIPAMPGHGGGIAADRATIRNNVIAFNVAKTGGGGMSTTGSDISNNIVFGNSLTEGSPGSVTVQVQPSITNVFRHNLIQDWVHGGVGNFSADPRFVDAAGGDFRLLPDSPAIDAGEAIEGLDRDFDGNPRPVVSRPGERRGDGSGTDIGPFEFQGALAFAPPGLLTLTEFTDAWGVVRAPGDVVDPPPARLAWLGYAHNADPGDATLAGDVTGDGLFDFLTVTWAGDLWMATNDGAGNLQNAFVRAEAEPVFREFADAPGAMAFLADARGEGRAALIALAPDGTARMAASLGTTFAAMADAGAPGVVWHPAAGLWVGAADVNGDGRADLVEVDTAAGTARVALSQGATFAAAEPWGTPGFRFDRAAGTGLHLGDVNGDGRADLIQIAPDSRIDVALSTGTGFAAPAFWGLIGFRDEPLRGRGWNVFVADMNGDGRDDLVQLTEHGDWWQSLSTGTGFAAPQHLGWTGFAHHHHGPWHAWVGRWRR